ncbi:MAG TPA: branched-chain amino acid ABC transporter permease [Methylomirabilota bacterium]|nr:branched-chain amino acid ABC transporter permease [Methylomirabilota bacterium]
MLSQVIISGITAGGVYALIALGFVMIYKATGIMNFAQGQFVMLSAYLAVTFHGLVGLSYPMTFVATVTSMALIGVLIERVFFRPLIAAPESSVIIATVTIGIILENAVRLVWGPEFYSFPGPFAARPIDVGVALVTPQEIWISAVTVVLFGALYLFFDRSRWGLAMRAVSISQTASALMGVSVRRVFSVTWGINSALGAAAGLLFAPLLAVTPGMGNVVATSAFAAAVLGGAKSLPGAVVGGFVLGIIENVVGFYVSTALKPMISFTVMIAILMVRPAGLLGREIAKKV